MNNIKLNDRVRLAGAPKDAPLGTVMDTDGAPTVIWDAGSGNGQFPSSELIVVGNAMEELIAAEGLTLETAK